MEKLSTSVCHSALYVDDLQGRHVLHRQFHSSDRNRQDHWGFVPSVSSVYLLFTSSSSCWGWMLHKTGGLFSVKWNIYIQKHISTPLADVTEMTQKRADRLKSPAFYWCLWSRDHVLILFCISTQQCHKDSIGLISSFIRNALQFFFLAAFITLSLFVRQASSLHQKLHPHAPLCFLHATSSQHLREGQSCVFQGGIAGLWLCSARQLKNC